MKFTRIKKLIFLHLQHLPMPSRRWRPFFCKCGGITIKDYKNTFIGENVIYINGRKFADITDEGITMLPLLLPPEITSAVDVASSDDDESQEDVRDQLNGQMHLDFD